MKRPLRKKTSAKAENRAFYLRMLLKEIQDVREAKYRHSQERCQYTAFGMITAGLFLNQLTRDEYDRLWELATNADYYRWNELQRVQGCYTWKVAPATNLEAAA